MPFGFSKPDAKRINKAVKSVERLTGTNPNSRIHAGILVTPFILTEDMATPECWGNPTCAEAMTIQIDERGDDCPTLKENKLQTVLRIDTTGGDWLAGSFGASVQWQGHNLIMWISCGPVDACDSGSSDGGSSSGP